MHTIFRADGARIDAISCCTADGIPAVLVRESTPRYTADDLYLADGRCVSDPNPRCLQFAAGERPRRVPDIPHDDLAALVLQMLEAEVWAVWSGDTPRLPVRVERLPNGMPVWAEVDGRVCPVDYARLLGEWNFSKIINERG